MKKRFVATGLPKKHIFALTLFLTMVVYQFVFVAKCAIPRVDSVCYVFHAVDFSFGFCSRFLQGAIYKALCGVYTEFAATVFENILLLLTLAGIALMLEWWMKSIPGKYRTVCLVPVLFFVTGAYTLSPYTLQLGMPDIFWVVFSMLLIVAVLHPKTVWLSIPLCILMAMIHYAAVLCFLPFCWLFMLYRASGAENKTYKRNLLLCFGLSVATALFLIVYFLLFDTENLRYTMEQFDRILLSRNATYLHYYDYAFFRETNSYAEDFAPVFAGDGPLVQAANAVANQIQVTLSLTRVLNHRIDSEFWCSIFCLVPILLVFARILFFVFRKDRKNHLRRFSVLCMGLMFFVTVLYGNLFSTDYVRFIGHAYLCLFASVLLILADDREALAKFCSIVSGIPWIAIAGHWVCYASIALQPYT